MSRVRSVDAAWARQVATYLDARGKPAALILKEVGLEPKEISAADARIPLARHAALLEAAAKHLDDPSFGLHLGSGIDVFDAEAIGNLAGSVRTLGQSFRNLESYIRVVSDGIQPRMDIEDQMGVFAVGVIDPDVRDPRQLSKFALAMIMNFARIVTGRRFAPAWVELGHEAGTDDGEHERYFGTAVHFGQPRNALVFHGAQLYLPCLPVDTRLLKILEAHSSEVLKQRRGQADLKKQVEYVVATLLPSGEASNERVRRELGMSERTLARRLGEQGTSFGEILVGVRHSLALRYLKEPEARPTHIAYLLGYAEPAAFNHAFRRWTGVSPTEFVKAGGSKG